MKCAPSAMPWSTSLRNVSAECRRISVGAKLDRETLHEMLAGFPGDGPTDPHQLLARLKRDVFPNNLHVDHPRFFAFVPGPNNFVSVMADALAAGFNVFNGTGSVAPPRPRWNSRSSNGFGNGVAFPKQAAAFSLAVALSRT